MITIRKYKKLGWWDLLERMENDLAEKPSPELYIAFMDELFMRTLESVSEGGSYKIKKAADDLFIKFKNESFASAEHVKTLEDILAKI